MLRAFFLYLSQAGWARRIITDLPLARKAAARFVAGNTVDEALETMFRVNQEGLLVTLDHVGENVTNPAESLGATEDYLTLIARLEDSGVKGNVSLKLTQLGINLDHELCLENMRRIAARAEQSGMMVRIDMEDSSVVDQTLAIWRSLREDGLTNIGLVFQSYLYRTDEDLQAALAQGARIRLVKGAYDEPSSVAYPRKSDVDASFDRLTALIIDQALSDGSQPPSTNGRVPPVAAIATHDEKRIDFAIGYANKVGLPKHALEFQMLYGIRSDLQRKLAADGYPVRVYIPFGTEWFSYYMRRIAERPANLWFPLKTLFKR